MGFNISSALYHYQIIELNAELAVIPVSQLISRNAPWYG